MKKFTLEMLPFIVLFAMLIFASCEAQKKSITPTKVETKYNLNEKQIRIMVHGGTERPFSSPYNKEKRAGVYTSPASGDTLFLSTAKFDSGTGWPSFDDATDNVSLGASEQGGYEVIEKSTGLHLGHLFKYEKFTKKNMRYCINGDALIFLPKGGNKHH